MSATRSFCRRLRSISVCGTGVLHHRAKPDNVRLSKFRVLDLSTKDEFSLPYSCGAFAHPPLLQRLRVHPKRNGLAARRQDTRTTRRCSGR